jgi:hypothetical protein
MAPIQEGSRNVPPQAFQQWNDPQGTKLVAIHRDGSVFTVGGITFSDGSTQSTAAAASTANVTGNPTTGLLTIQGSSLTNLYPMQGLNRATLGDGTFDPAVVVSPGGNFLIFDNSSGSQWRIGGTGLLSVQRAPIQFGSPADCNISSTGPASMTMGNGIDQNASATLSLAKVVVSGATWSSGTVAPNGNVTGNIGDLYTNKNGTTSTTLWVKESGAATNTGWVAK